MVSATLLEKVRTVSLDLLSADRSTAKSPAGKGAHDPPDVPPVGDCIPAGAAVLSAACRECLLDLRTDDAAEAQAAAAGGLPRWLAAWKHRYDLCTAKLAEPYPPVGGQRFECTQAEDGICGTIYCHYDPKEYGIDMRWDLVIPGTMREHFQGLMEPDLAFKICPNLFSAGEQFRSEYPGSFLFSLISKPPMLPARWHRDIVLHRQVMRRGKGFAVVDYSPRCEDLACNLKCAKCQAYFAGGAWPGGLAGVDLPPVTCSGRECQYAEYIVEPCEGGESVRFRAAVVIQICLPKWVWVPKWFFAWCAAQMVRKTLRSFHRAHTEPETAKLYAERVRENPRSYMPAWWDSL